MPGMFHLKAIVGAKPSIHGMLNTTADAVETGGNPCPLCAENANSANPITPPLHQHCHCELVPVHISAAF